MKEKSTKQRSLVPKYAKRIFSILLPLISAALCTLALWVLYHEFRNYHLHDVVQYFHELSVQQLLFAVLCSIFSYFFLTQLDSLGLRYIRHPLEYRKIAIASYTGYAFSNNIGYSMISGGVVRYRLYSTWGLSAIEVTEVVAFCGFTSFLGYLTVSGTSFLLEPETIPTSLHLPVSSVRPLGLLFLIFLAGYFLLITFTKKTLRIRKFTFQLPSPKFSLIQVLFSSFDWISVSSVLYFLLPKGSGVSHLGFIGIFMLGQLAGMVSRVPGGLGIFEMVMVLLLPHTVTHSQIIGALVSFRIIYYFVPLITAAMILGSYELQQRKKDIKRIVGIFRKQASHVYNGRKPTL